MLKYRKPGKNDAFLIEKWINLDSYHAQTCDPSFWTTEEKGRIECFVPQDDEGPVFYCRSENILRLHIQFPPVYSRAEKFRLAKAIDQFTSDIKQMAKGKYTQIIFESTAPSLIAFLEKRGFRKSNDDFVCEL